MAGFDYQILYSWWEMLRLLDPHGRYESATLEHDDVEGIDDLVLKPRRGTDAARYFQIKWHTNEAKHYTLDLLTSDETPVLQRAFRGWEAVRKQHQIVEIWLVSNWTADPRDLGQYIDHRRDQGFTARFYESPDYKTLIAKMGKPAADVDAFCKSLRFRLGFLSLSDFYGDFLDDRMARFGLKFDNAAKCIAERATRKMIRHGGDDKRIDREKMLQIVAENDLASSQEDAPSIRLAVEAYTEIKSDWPTRRLSFLDLFDRTTQRYPQATEWPRIVAELLEQRTQIESASSEKLIDVRGDFSPAMALALGATFPAARGYRLRFAQNGQARPWVSLGGSDARFAVTEESCAGTGRDVLVVFHITGDISDDVQKFLQARPDQFARVVHARPSHGVGELSVRTNGDAVALAAEGAEILKSAYWDAPLVHTLTRAPNAFLLFLGMRLNSNVVGPIQTYDYFGKHDGYQPAIRVTSAWQVDHLFD